MRQTSLEYRLERNSDTHRFHRAIHSGEGRDQHKSTHCHSTKARWHANDRRKKIILLLKLQNCYVILVNRLGSLQLCVCQTIDRFVLLLPTPVAPIPPPLSSSRCVSLCTEVVRTFLDTFCPSNVCTYHRAMPSPLLARILVVASEKS